MKSCFFICVLQTLMNAKGSRAAMVPVKTRWDRTTASASLDLSSHTTMTAWVGTVHRSASKMPTASCVL